MSESTEYGEMIYPSLFAWEYSQLGALAWLDIPEEELTHMLSAYSVLLKDEKNIELLLRFLNLEEKI